MYSTRGGFLSASGCVWNPARRKSPATLPWWQRQDFKNNKGNSGLSASPWLSLRVCAELKRRRAAPSPATAGTAGVRLRRVCTDVMRVWRKRGRDFVFVAGL